MDYPVIFIPGLFGSLGDDVIKGTGEFSFGFAKKVYGPFIEILKAMGYKEGKDLFISHYDWKSSVLDSVGKYLAKDIERIIKKTGKEKVIIIGHSLGGLLGRAYTSYYDSNRIAKLIMIGSPNLGAVSAYQFWSGGRLPYSKIEENILYNGLKAIFILYYKYIKGINHIKALRNIFPVAQDLLPSHNYGDYLVLETDKKKTVPVESMDISNHFLNKLGKENIDKNKLFIISGKGVFTDKKYIVKKTNKRKIKWADGKPTNAYKTNYGDGTVTTHSTLAGLDGDKKVFEGDHTNILYNSKKYLSSILNRPLIKDVKIEEIEKVYVVLVRNCGKINIETPEINIVSNKGIEIIDSRIQAVNLSKNNFGIIASGGKNLDLKLNIKDTRKKSKVYQMVIEKNDYKKSEGYYV